MAKTILAVDDSASIRQMVAFYRCLPMLVHNIHPTILVSLALQRMAHTSKRHRKV